MNLNNSRLGAVIAVIILGEGTGGQAFAHGDGYKIFPMRSDQTTITLHVAPSDIECEPADPVWNQSQIDIHTLDLNSHAILTAETISKLLDTTCDEEAQALRDKVTAQGNTLTVEVKVEVHEEYLWGITDEQTPVASCHHRISQTVSAVGGDLDNQYVAGGELELEPLSYDQCVQLFGGN